MTTISPSGLRPLLTPEGVQLRTRLGDVGVRIAAFAIDLTLMIMVAVGLLVLVASLPLGDEAEDLALSLLFIAYFLIRYFYFTILESGRRAATWGKRIMRLRVASRTHPRLSANAVFTRNALRELEFFLPIQFMLSPESGVDGLINLLFLIWVGVFLFFPLFNRDRLRVGDLLAGTWVVRAPRPKLLADLSEVQPRGDFAFSPEQVDAYGVHELHVLEDVLRDGGDEMIGDVALRIRRKIGWTRAASERDRDFLDAYYRALRERLEQRLMFGVRREDKYDTR